MEPHFCDIKIQFLWKNPIFVEKLEALCCFSLAVGSAWSTQSSMESGNPCGMTAALSVAPPEFLVLKRWYYGFMMIYVRSLNVDIMLI